MRIIVGEKRYNTETSTRICETPQGTLFKKKKGSQEFFIYNINGKTNKEKITSIPWSEASNLVKTYGSRELWIDMFTAMEKSTCSSNRSPVVSFDDYHYIKAQRNANRLNLTLKEYIMRLIDRDDNNRNY